MTMADRGAVHGEFYNEGIWEPDDASRSRLTAVLYLTNESPGSHGPDKRASLAMHLTAIEVVRTDGMQNAVNSNDSEELDDLTLAFHPDGGWATMTIASREYVIFGEPFSP